MVGQKRVRVLLRAIIAFFLTLACLPLSRDEKATQAVPDLAAPIPTATIVTDRTSLPPTPTTAAVEAPGRLLPSDLHYLGAFRLPDTEDDLGWTWSGHALAYHPGGDPSGPEDGYPGSLFGTGNDQKQFVSEISIPVPVHSEGKDLEALHAAQTLQPFADIRDGLYDGLAEMDDLESALPKAGLAASSQRSASA